MRIETNSYLFMIVDENTQIRLSVKLQGRFRSHGANSSNKRQRKKYARALKYGSKKILPYDPSSFFEVTQSVMISHGAPLFFISEEGRCGRVSSSDWKKKSKADRISANLQVIADGIANRSGAEFTWEIIN